MGKCTWCSCEDEEHEEYYECPLINNKLLCDVCCNYDIDSIDAIDFIKRITNKDITEKEIEQTCARCRKPYLLEEDVNSE